MAAGQAEGRPGETRVEGGLACLGEKAMRQLEGIGRGEPSLTVGSGCWVGGL